METESMNATSLKLTENSLVFMRETVKWAKFLAICSFVGLGLMVLVGVVFLFLSVSAPGPAEMKISTSAVGIFYILIAVLYFFPAIYLYRFAIASAEAINTLNDDTLEEGLENLKSLFRFTGILMIIVLSLYAVGFILAIVLSLIKM
ncbi:MAG: DUF5362 family protein [Crocinitomicaceae bacterium]|jgi:hypothetical protein|nr:DUF5362 family protein [Crocinitomicaceae bacterium]